MGDSPDYEEGLTPFIPLPLEKPQPLSFKLMALNIFLVLSDCLKKIRLHIITVRTILLDHVPYTQQQQSRFYDGMPGGFEDLSWGTCYNTGPITPVQSG